MYSLDMVRWREKQGISMPLRYGKSLEIEPELHVLDPENPILPHVTSSEDRRLKTIYGRTKYVISLKCVRH
jgi:hypothetical protein